MRKDRISYDVILDAKHGSSEAMKAILRHFDRYIRSCAFRTYYDRYGNAHRVLDDDIRQNIETALMLSIIYKYDPHRLPEGEVLEESK